MAICLASNMSGSSAGGTHSLLGPNIVICSAISFPVNGYDLIALLKNPPALIEVMVQLFNADEPNELI